MATVTDLLQILSTLPDVEEYLTWNSTMFRVGGKIIAIIHPSETNVVLKASKSEQAALIAADPQTYAHAPYTGRFGWVTVQLSSVPFSDLRDLVVEAWHSTAPKRVVATYYAESSS